MCFWNIRAGSVFLIKSMVNRLPKDAILQNVKSSEIVRTDMFNCVEKPIVCLHAVTQALVKKLMSSKSEW